jgi:hypothetical protein
MSSVPLRARATIFAFDSETGSRRPRWFAVVAGLLALLLIAAGVLVGVGAAAAHTPKVTVDCYGVTVELKWYDGAGDNSLRVVYGDQVHEVADFGTDLPSTTFAFTNPAEANAWSVVVVAHDDDGSKGWSVDESGTSTPCDAPAIDLTATECNTIDGSTTLTATFSKLLGGQTYTAQLFKNDVAEGAPFTPSTTSPTIWPDMDAGVTYQLTVTSVEHAGLSKTVSTVVVGCPQNSRLVVTVTECTSPTNANAAVEVTASQLVPQRSYAAVVWQNGVAITGAIPVNPGNDTSVVFVIPVPPSTGGMTVVLTDTASDTSVTSTAFSTKTCPSDPAKPAVGSEVCTEVGGALEITVTLDGLTATRVYLVEIDGIQVDEITAGGSSHSGLTYPVTAGIHTVTVIDKTVPSITTSSDLIDVKDCPTQPEIAFAVTECLEAGGQGEITATLTSLGVGREYTVTITENGDAVPGYETAETVTSASAPLRYVNLPAGKIYTVTVIDKLATNVKEAASVTLEQCPMTPELALTLECLFLQGDSLISATLDGLEPGEEYDVTIEDDASPAPAGTTTTVTAGGGPTTAVFQVPNNFNYTVTVTKVSNPLVTNSAEIFAAICDLPTFPLPPELPELPTLALTGAADTTLPMLGALGLVQFGVALLALAAMLQFSPTRRRV